MGKYPLNLNPCLNINEAATENRHPNCHPEIQVEPQEKKKTPKGRAYKRVLYTRRFVNVTMTGGKRKVHPD
ncbi:hypothetical protein N7450_004287 [Penicillium hetheringtonii]|uniref:40S ribosomal protein S30 n=1 Tax=Penicillium hetheringtonii TaxID=911720 RepID=A0AAD6DPS4_9EURO|nr:hypothetical protein N7450_004287 [Penicillium hetheringtonii]